MIAILVSGREFLSTSRLFSTECFLFSLLIALTGTGIPDFLRPRRTLPLLLISLDRGRSLLGVTDLREFFRLFSLPIEPASDDLCAAFLLIFSFRNVAGCVGETNVSALLRVELHLFGKL